MALNAVFGEYINKVVVKTKCFFNFMHSVCCSPPQFLPYTPLAVPGLSPHWLKHSSRSHWLPLLSITASEPMGKEWGWD